MNVLRQALRQFFRLPGFTAIVVLSLGLGLGANTIVFSWIDTILLRPLPGVRDSGEIVALIPTQAGHDYGHCISPPDIADYNALHDVFVGVIGSQITPASLTINHEQQWVYGQITTANFFDVLGVRALPGLGRTFLPSDGDKPGGNPVLILSEACWRSRFGADAAAIGRTVDLNQHRFTIIGVVPAAFRGTMSGLVPDFWAPVTMHREVSNSGSLTARNDRWLHTQARLQPGVSRAQAQAAVDVCAQQLAQAFPENRDMSAAVIPMWQTPYGGQAVFLPVLKVLAIVGLVILLLVTANVANLMLARATARRRETSIRLAVGAGRRHLLGQWLAESTVLALAGGLLGLLFTLWAPSLFAVFMPETAQPVGYSFAVNGRVLAVAFGLSLVTGLLFGLAPGLFAARTNLQEAMKDGARAVGESAASRRLRNLLVIGEVALALILLVGAALCIRGARQVRELDPGFKPERVLVAGLRIGMNGYDEARGLTFYRELRQRLADTPGVAAVGLASWFPLGFEGGPSLGVRPEGYTPAPGESMSVPYSIVSPGYFETLGIPLRSGRDFTDADDATTSPVAIVNEAMAQRYWPGRDAIGQKFRTWRGTAVIVGVVPTGRYRSLNERSAPFFYLPYQQGVWDLNLGVAVRTVGPDPRAAAAMLHRALQALDPNVAVWVTLPMNEYVKAAYLVNQIAMALLTALGGVALVLAALGLYGVMAFVVGRRRPEIGIRLALGARPAQIGSMVLRDGLRLVGLGLVVGTVGAVLTGVGLARTLPGVSAYDVPALFAVAAVLTLVSLLACWLPARRAMQVDPITTLHAD